MTTTDELAIKIADYTDADELRRDLALFAAAPNMINCMISDYQNDCDDADMHLIDDNLDELKYSIACALLDTLALDDQS